MIKFSAVTGEGTTIVGLGLSDDNLRLLRHGKPIVVELEEVLGHGRPMDERVRILLFAGATEAAMVEELRAAGVRMPEDLDGPPQRSDP